MAATNELLHPSRPIAIIDRDGNLWPWDGRQINEHLLSAGSKYIYDRAEYDAAVAELKARTEAQAQERVTQAVDPTVEPEPRDPISAQEVNTALGMSPLKEGKKNNRGTQKTDPMAGG